jgi:hypothetical protein
VNAINHQWMMRGAAQPAALRKDRKAVAAGFFSFCDSFSAFSRLPPHSLEAVFLCPAGARTIGSVASACENAALVNHENII